MSLFKNNTKFMFFTFLKIFLAVALISIEVGGQSTSPRVLDIPGATITLLGSPSAVILDLIFFCCGILLIASVLADIKFDIELLKDKVSQ